MTNLSRWSLAFTVAVIVVLVAGSLLRSFARRAPGAATPAREAASSRAARRLLEAQSRGSDLPRRRLGGVPLLLGFLVGFAFTPVVPGRIAIALLMAIALVAAGVAVELGALPRVATVAAPFAAAFITYVGGVRAHPTGSTLLDFVLSILWMGMLATAFRGFGDAPGASAGIGAAVAVGLFALAAFAEQSLIAVMAAAIGGACLGFLAYNLRPASLFAGRGGGLLIGFVLSVATIEVAVPISRPGHLVVPILLVTIPLLDVVVVVLGRLHHNCPLTLHRGDHLTHRLTARGLVVDTAVGILIFLQFLLSVLAVFVGRGIVPAPIGLGVLLLVVLILLSVTARQLVYTDAQVNTRRLVLLAGGAFVLVILASLPALLAGVDARRTLDDGRRDAEAAVRFARNGEPDKAADSFAAAADKFESARSTLNSPLVTPGLLVPVLSPNLDAARQLSDAGVDLARAGERLTRPVDPEKLRVRGGQVDLAEVRRITPSLGEAALLLAQTSERVDAIDTDFLLPPVKDALQKVTRELGRTETDARRGAQAALKLPAILGADGPRRYFLAVQNNAEARASGGIILFWGILTADDGKIDLDELRPIRQLNEDIPEGVEPVIDAPPDYLARYGRYDPQHTWQNVNLSPDFPAVGQVIASLFPQSGGYPIDGVVRVDPYGLAALLKLTGPVEVEPWDVPITAENVVQITLRDAYAAFESENEREDFLSDVGSEVVDRASSGDLGAPGKIAEALGEAAQQGHVALYFTRPDEQDLARLLDADGSMKPVRKDDLLVTTQNAGSNKLDYYLQRSLDYEVLVDPSEDGLTADVTGTLGVTLENTVDPKDELPQTVIGPNVPDLERGDNLSIVSVYSPLQFEAGAVNGLPLDMSTERENGRNVVSDFFTIPGRGSLDFQFDVAGTVALGPEHWYRLDLGEQPTVNPDLARVQIMVPSGWRIAEAHGVRATESGMAMGRFEVVEPTDVRVRLERSGDRNLWDRLKEGP
jgi:UDP-N-acetylmuramyl pentapeptide phosphotransferase/UDP-N-acetylglucosamine-1-phosphate transferase